MTIITLLRRNGGVLNAGCRLGTLRQLPLEKGLRWRLAIVDFYQPLVLVDFKLLMSCFLATNPGSLTSFSLERFRSSLISRFKCFTLAVSGVTARSCPRESLSLLVALSDRIRILG